MPSKPAAAVAGTLYFVASLGLFTRLVISKSWWGLCLPIAAVCKSPAIIPDPRRCFWLSSPFSHLYGILCARCTRLLPQLDCFIYSPTTIYHCLTGCVSGFQLHTIWTIHRAMCQSSTFVYPSSMGGSHICYIRYLHFSRPGILNSMTYADCRSLIYLSL
jgi:hypothetical protein